MTPHPHEWPPYQCPVGVIQPLPGIGDMVWHLPHIRAIAAHAGQPVTLLTKPRTLADQLLAHEPSIAGLSWLDLNPSGRRGAHDGIGGFNRLVRRMRSFDFGTIVLLHHSPLLAAAAWRAGIPDRRGYGWGRQRWFLNTGPFLPPDVKKMHQHTRATRYLEAAGIPLPSAEPSLLIPPATLEEAMTRLGHTEGGYVTIGIGSSEELRQWGSERFAQLATALLDAGWPTLVLVGGLEDMVTANMIMNAMDDRRDRIRLALGWNLSDVIGVLSQAAFYVGNNTGVMNIAAATGVRTYALFGTTEPFHHASQIVAVTSPDTGEHDGMVRLTLDAVVKAIVADRGALFPLSIAGAKEDY
ncbi:MAG TPA: glycosyl transferase family 1 [Acetobacteraceae bacterium]|jgi:heptosyltransferase II|nr:glycosyl transferase family 1 [Acetobacteraceae bacterium]